MYRKYLFFSMMITLLTASCGQTASSPTPPLPDATSAPPISLTHTGEPLLSNEWAYTSIQWVQGEVENKLFLDSGGDVDTDVVSVGTPPVEARRTGNGQALPSPDGNKVEDYYMQFRIDDSVLFAGSPTTLVRIEVEYFNQGTDSFVIQYDALAGGPQGNGLFKETDPVIKTDSQSFQTAVFTLDDAYFANRDNGADFRISDLNDGAEIIRSVTVTLLKEPTGTAADIIFYNGQVVTVDEDMTQAEALAIKGETIMAVGSDAEILALQGPNTEMIDLGGQTLLPGLADGHTHFLFRAADRGGRTLDEAQDVALKLGLTSVTEMVGDDGFIERLLEAEEAGELRMRVNVFPNYNFGVLTDEGEIWYSWFWYPGNDPILDSERMLRIPGIKIFVDGAGTPRRGCPAMSEPYDEEAQSQDWFKETCFSEYGDLYWEQEELNQVVAELQAAGYRVAFHAMGDRAIETTLDAIAFALGDQPNELHRHQIQHSSLLRPDLLERYIQMDMLSSVRGYFNTCDQDDYGKEWAANRYALPGLGVHAYLEMDFGWTADPDDFYALRNTNPMVHFWGLVTHEQVSPDGSICTPAPWLSKHVITVEQALRMMTYEPAYAVSQEDVLGTLEPGKFADMIILSDHPLTIDPNDLKDLEVWMTMVAGQMEYCAPGHEDICP